MYLYEYVFVYVRVDNEVHEESKDNSTKIQIKFGGLKEKNPFEIVYNMLQGW